MYKLVYVVDGDERSVKNVNPKILRDIVKHLKKGSTWRFFNEGGICLDSSEEHEE